MSARLVVVRECYECAYVYPPRAVSEVRGEIMCEADPENYRALPVSATTNEKRARIPAWCPLPKAPRKGRR